MKNTRLTIVGAFCVFMMTFLLSPSPANAADPFDQVCSNPGTSSSSVCAADSSNPVFGPTGVVTKVTQIVATGVGIVAVFMIIISGFKFIMAGDPQAVSSARSGIIFALIGIVVAVFAQAIVFFVLRKL